MSNVQPYRIPIPFEWAYLILAAENHQGLLREPMQTNNPLADHFRVTRESSVFRTQSTTYYLDLS